MRKYPLKVAKSLETRKQEHAFRNLGNCSSLIDFSSNDYLGIAASKEVFWKSHEILLENSILQNGATGSRLLSGNHKLYEIAEKAIAKFHETEAALIFNSGYDANVGIFSSIPKRNDIILYDEFVHASIRDGISMGKAKAYKFRHNDLSDLRRIAKKVTDTNDDAEVFVVTEAVFSMDGDSPNFETMLTYAEEQGFFLIIDEAHSVGVDGTNGSGLVQKMAFQERIFARIVTFGKALGAHGAAVLGSEVLRDYLINFARSFIYTTALPPHALATVIASYEYLQNSAEVEKLNKRIHFFQSEVQKMTFKDLFLESDSAIHCCILPGNEKVKAVSARLKKEGFDVKAILSPTVSPGKERLRICLHSFNSEEEISRLLFLINTFVK
ncbi:aminotransferase class I/II-fold pyridoxal phosphate-dependent enzyme [Salinimicrobium sp. GXAS 041]|uniref:aminotransferase class I/II-fold pyridoxal phosphate-dependent enzyme n=1 Tax=Salinimicrobium sp. GXAS 041 TaxID=3400806 RepID=UPI003C78973F